VIGLWTVGLLALLGGICLGVEIERAFSRRQRPLERLARHPRGRENGWAVLGRLRGRQAGTHRRRG
jgi:hypothetical protein